ncbi:hypothetical protein MMYC01_202028 [Madurella mycetomatis]|uniref:F-box domain-containing protein n=1 Tax=Madurella mycetomatis TaxID=100816 RepID=A0A175WD73_9PEZI|nr:hypothetical protein MMYC01_202028 [Madurella mycetomatis]
MERVPQLPPEIWLMILEFLPPSFFQQDIGRLALCKRWYSLAFPTFYPKIEYTPRVISRLVNRKSKSLDKSRALLRKSLRCVNIVLEGVGPWGDPDLMCFNTPANLGRFCLMLLEFRELKTVRFAARWQNRDWRADPWQPDYLHLRSLEPYISLLTHVTSLDLDLCGTDIIDDSGTIHFCPHIRPLLSRLRSLRLRMRCVCQLALRPPEGQTVSVGELTVSLYLGTVSEVNPKLNSARRCYPPTAWEWTNPIDEMRLGLKRLAARMADPKRAELVHLAPSGEIHTWDASTDACVRDGAEKLRQFPLFREMESGPCFAEIPETGTPDTGIPDAWDLADTDDGEVLNDIHDGEVPSGAM